jgi:hypothetical protein
MPEGIGHLYSVYTAGTYQNVKIVNSCFTGHDQVAFLLPDNFIDNSHRHSDVSKTQVKTVQTI